MITSPLILLPPVSSSEFADAAVDSNLDRLLDTILSQLLSIKSLEVTGIPFL